MMKYWLRPQRLVLLICLASAGCVVTSSEPFYKPSNIVDASWMDGEWTVIRKPKVIYKGEEYFSGSIEKPWKISSGGKNTHFETIDESGATGALYAIFFKLDKTMFCDFSGLPPGNRFQKGLLLPVHTIARVDVADNELKFIALDAEWFNRYLQTEASEFKKETDYTARGLFTCGYKKWDSFLDKHATNQEAFPENGAYVLRRADTKQSRP